MTKDEIRKLYVEATARKLVLRQEARDLQDDLIDQIMDYQEEHDAPPLTANELLDAVEEAIELSGLPPTAGEVQGLRHGVGIAVAMVDELAARDGKPSASQIGRVL